MPSDRSTVAGLLARRRQRGEHPLLICDTDRLTYADAEYRSARLARGLIALGAGKDTHVGLLYPNGSEFVVAMLAAARIGAVVVPFSTFLTAQELRTQLVGGDIEILLATTSYRSHDYRQRLAEAIDTESWEGEKLFTVNAPVLRHAVFDTQRLLAVGETVSGSLLTAMEGDVDGCDTLAIVYTSGSTGAPKGAMHSHASLLDHQADLNEIRGLSAHDRLFSNSPFFWIGGFAFGLLATLVAGSTLICTNATDAGATLDLIDAERPTVTNGFAAAVTHLTHHPSYSRRDFSALRRGNLYPIMATDVRPADPALRHNMLGMTEAGSVLLICADESDQPECRRGSFGRPAPGFETKVVAPDSGTRVESGVTGELCIRGPYVMQGYYGRGREDCFDADGWFHTGDLVRTDDEGFVYFVTRSGAMIKTAGANVTPAEVERALRKVLVGLDGEVTVHVVGLPDPERGQVVAAVVALDDPAEFDEATVRDALRTEISAYQVPKVFAVCRPGEIPLLPSGKVDLPGLVKLFET